MSLEKEKKTYPGLDKLSTEELEKLLRQDIEADSEEVPDIAYISAILEVIHERRALEAEQESVDVEAAWQNFQQFYREDPLSLQNDSPRPEPSPHPRRSEQKAKSKKQGGWRRLLPIAAIVAVLVCGSMAASAFGFDLFELFAGWNSEHFQFVSPWRTEEADEQSAEDPFRQLRSAVERLSDSPVIPNWAPSGTKALDHISQEMMSDKTKISVIYECDEGHFSFVVYLYDMPLEEAAVYQKDDDIVVEYLQNDIIHYIMNNNGKNTVAWHNDNVEVMIQGDLDVDELEKMIDSIYEGVDNF
ncbi:DUF4367 domain-containing protein [uncultured Intestinimonas sp.]|nr:DUF4367 domain-containing protein [uncultured Intestinimonas sp.]